MSFGVGMAIAYVFTHLLPEIAAGNRLLSNKIFLVALLGFVVYYGLEWLAGGRLRWVRGALTVDVAVGSPTE